MKSMIFVAAALAAGPAAFAQDEPSQPLNIHDLEPASVPLVMMPLDLTQKSDPIWVKGDRPKENKIAEVVLRPVAAVVVDDDFGQGSGKSVVLSLALPASGMHHETVKEALAAEKKFFCTAGSGAHSRKVVCLRDEDGDGRFERLALGVSELGLGPEQLSILAKPTMLPKPVSFRPARDEELPRFDAAYTNCAKDFDRPRFSLSRRRDSEKLETALGTLNVGGSLTPQQMQSMLARLMTAGSGPCQTADRVGERDPLYPSGQPEGAVVARLGELMISVGPKKSGAPVRLLGFSRPDRLYRMVGGAVKVHSAEPTAMQNALAVKQKFDKPVLITSGAATVMEGERKVGDTLLQAGFTHGYMGVLTQDTKIRTLLSSRSLARGTLLYGMPMSSRRVLTMNGVPVGPTNIEPSTAEDVRLTWCVPVEDDGKWTATCLPDQDGRYTLLKGQSPAFEVKSLSYSADTTTNKGAVPVARQPGSDFGKPLTYRFTLTEVSGYQVSLTQETLFGDAVVYSREHHIPFEKGEHSVLMFGSGGIVLSDGGEPGTVTVKKLGEFKAGVDARVITAKLSHDPSKGVPSPPVSK